jgi:protoheme IX farnesyltransferase
VSSSKKLLQSYYHLAKPGIIYGNDISLVAGFLLASKTVGFDFWLLILTLLGVSLVIASACVFNNYIDRDIDQYMSRTKERAMVKKLIPARNAIIYAIILGVLGFILLILYTNWLTVSLGLIGFIDYLAFYTPSKRLTTHSTLIGTVSGAMPIVAGYTAVTNKLDGAALLLFLAMVFWQMAHFYAIAIRRIDEYKAAKLPVLPIKKGIKATKIQILFYIFAFGITASLLTVFGYTSLLYLAVIVLTAGYWLKIGIVGFKAADNKLWAKKMFLFSLVVMLVFSFSLILDSLIFGKIV